MTSCCLRCRILHWKALSVLPSAAVPAKERLQSVMGSSKRLIGLNDGIEQLESQQEPVVLCYLR